MTTMHASTVLATPSPLDRRNSPLSSSTLLNKHQLAQSLAPSTGTPLGASTTVQPLSFNPQAIPVRQTQSSILPSPSKTVRFSPAHPSTSSAFTPHYSSAPPSRIQSFATPPRSYSPSLLRTAQHNYASGAAATPPRQQSDSHQQQQQQPGSFGQQQGQQQPVSRSPATQAKQLLHVSEQRVQAALSKPSAAVHEVKEKLKAMPLGRGEAARRLRVNAILLVAWWVSSRTTAYRFAAGHLVAAAPQLDTPLHLFETCLLLLLCYNIIDSLRALNALSSLPSSSTIRPLPSLSSSPARPGPSRTVSGLGSPARSSPKTRPSPSVFGSPSSVAGSPTTARLRTSSSPFRASALASPSPPTPQTLTSALRGGNGEASSVLRRSLGGRNSPMGTNGGGSVYGTPLRLKTPGGAAEADEVAGALLAYEARHSPAAGSGSPALRRSVVLDSQEAIDRLLE
ncbi:hypothetical protein JCM8097_001268 [Rhodosporidiobolus ruineniae]